MNVVIRNIHWVCFAAAVALVLAITLGWARDVIRGDDIIVIDGDTVIIPPREKFRLLDIDTPELRGYTCEAERQLGLRAKARLGELLQGQLITITRRGIDPYGRTLGRLQGIHGDVGMILVGEAQALHWQPGAEARRIRKAFWCSKGRGDLR